MPENFNHEDREKQLQIMLNRYFNKTMDNGFALLDKHTKLKEDPKKNALELKMLEQKMQALSRAIQETFEAFKSNRQIDKANALNALLLALDSKEN